MPWVVAVIVVAGFLFGWNHFAIAKTETPQIVFLGDSLFAENGATGYVAESLGQALGKTVINGCMGGSSASWGDREYDYMSLYSLTKSIVSGNFDQQKSTHIDTPATEYFGEVIEKLSRVDFSKVDILVLKYGLNDYHMGRAMEGGSSKDPYSFLGALEYSVETLQTWYPDMRIVLVTPCFAWYLEAERTCENYDLGGGYLEEYVNAELAFAKEHGIEIIDQYHNFFPETQTESWSLYTVDGMHFNDTGKALAGKQLVEYFTTN